MKKNSVLIIALTFGGLGLLVGISVMLFTGNLPEYHNLTEERLREFLLEPELSERPLIVAAIEGEQNIPEDVLEPHFFKKLEDSGVPAALLGSEAWEEFRMNLKLLEQKTGFAFTRDNLNRLFNITKYAVFYEIRPLKAVWICECENPDSVFRSLFGGKTLSFKTTKIKDIYLLEPDDELNIWFSCAIEKNRMFISTDTALMRRFLVSYLKAQGEVRKALLIDAYAGGAGNNRVIFTPEWFSRQGNSSPVFNRAVSPAEMAYEVLSVKSGFAETAGNPRVRTLDVEDTIALKKTPGVPAGYKVSAALRRGEFYAPELFSYSYESADNIWHPVFEEFSDWFSRVAGAQIEEALEHTAVRLQVFEDESGFTNLKAVYVMPVKETDMLNSILKDFAVKDGFVSETIGPLCVIKSVLSGRQVFTYGVKDGFLFAGNSMKLVQSAVSSPRASGAQIENAINVRAEEFPRATAFSRMDFSRMPEVRDEFARAMQDVIPTGERFSAGIMKLLASECARVDNYTVRTGAVIRQKKVYTLKNQQ
ncbi:MAG: hypothetical protein HZA48_02650 [Planctomycetes bacterium]|nr:hypothetical protein [Planctomycetota bacterium]